MTSNFCENLSKQTIERPGLFADNFHNVYCFKSIDASENILNKIEIAIKYFTKLMTKNNPTQIASILFALADLPRILTSEKCHILFMLLEEATKNVARCYQMPKEPPAHIQTKTLLNLVSNFIHEWGEKPCEMRSHLKICRFCSSIINDKTQQYANTSKCVICTDAEHEIDYCNISREENAAKVHISDLQLISTNNNNDVSILLFKDQYYENRADSQMMTNPSDSVARDIHQRDVSLASAEVINTKEIERLAKSDHRFDRIDDEDPSEANGDRSLRRERTEMSAAGARNGSGTKNTDTKAERIREKRDNNPYRRKLDEIEDKDQQNRRSAQRDVQEEANGSRNAVEKSVRDRDTDDVKTKRNGAVRGNLRPYQHGRREERGTRLSDNSAKKIGRLDRTEEKSAALTKISKNPTKKVQRDHNGDRYENEEKPVIREDRKKARSNKDEEEGTTPVSKNKEPRIASKKMIDSVDDAEKERFAVNKEGEPSTSDGKHKNASISKRNDLEQKKRKANSSNPIEYRLSNVHFVKLGWTLLPITKSLRKIVQYEARPAKQNLWFKKYRHKGTVYYDDGTIFLKFHSDDSSQIFYPNGILAIRVYKPENRKYDMYAVFTLGGKDALGIGRVSQILAIFDTMGNGVVFDEDGTARLSYNQIGGIFTDNPAGLPLVWTWHSGPREPILETVYTEKLTDQSKFVPAINKSVNSSGNVKTPISQSSSRNKEKKVVKVQKPVVEQRQEEEVESKLNDNRDFSGKNTFHIKIICMKLNEFLGLRIVDQKNISLQFSAKNKSIRIELGTSLNFNKEIASCMVEASDWKSDLLKCRFQEKLSQKLESDSSLCDLAKEYEKVKKYAKERKLMIAKYKPFLKINHGSDYKVKNNTKRFLNSTRV